MLTVLIKFKVKDMPSCTQKVYRKRVVDSHVFILPKCAVDDSTINIALCVIIIIIIIITIVLLLLLLLP